MESDEVFLAFHTISRTNAETLLQLVKTSLLDFNLSGIRGQGYDGATNVAGKDNGLQAKLLAENSKALYLYCLGHQLNLSVQDSLVLIPEVSIALERDSVVNFIKNSPKKIGRFNNIVQQQENYDIPHRHNKAG